MTSDALPDVTLGSHWQITNLHYRQTSLIESDIDIVINWWQLSVIASAPTSVAPTSAVRQTASPRPIDNSYQPMVRLLAITFVLSVDTSRDCHCDCLEWVNRPPVPDSVADLSLRWNSWRAVASRLSIPPFTSTPDSTWSSEGMSTLLLSRVPIRSDCHSLCRVESYSCKLAGNEKKLYKIMHSEEGRSPNDLQALSPPQTISERLGHSHSPVRAYSYRYWSDIHLSLSMTVCQTQRVSSLKC